MEQAKWVIEELRKERTISQRGSSAGSFKSHTSIFSGISRERENIRIEKEKLQKVKKFIEQQRIEIERLTLSCKKIKQEIIKVKMAS